MKAELQGTQIVLFPENDKETLALEFYSQAGTAHIYAIFDYSKISEHKIKEVRISMHPPLCIPTVFNQPPSLPPPYQVTCGSNVELGK